MSLQELQRHRASIDSRKARPFRILVVEDEPDICKLNAETLIDLGYIVDTAGDGIMAWEALQHNSYDLLVTDNEMPRLSGAGLLEKLHHNRKFLPVIMATGTIPPAKLTRRPWFPLVTTLLKPYTLVEFIATVKDALHKSVW
jgi:CheY-like chemotaxis protein